MERPILTYPDPLLKKRSEAVPRVTPAVRELVRDLFDTMRAARGVGLAAPQIGVLKRVIVVDVSGVEPGVAPLAFVNPRIAARRGRVEGTEGCLSIPGVEGVVPRAEWVAVEGLDERGEFLRVEATGLLARALQHEIDHLDGILFIDRMPAAPASS